MIRLNTLTEKEKKKKIRFPEEEETKKYIYIYYLSKAVFSANGFLSFFFFGSRELHKKKSEEGGREGKKVRGVT